MPYLNLKVKNRKILSPIFVIPSDGETLFKDKAKEYVCLFDTGATRTNISPRVQAELDIKPTAERLIRTASGVVSADSCMFGIEIPMENDEMPLFEVQGSVLDLSSEFDVLLGMDIITQGSFKIDFDGSVSFRL